MIATLIVIVVLIFLLFFVLPVVLFFSKPRRNWETDPWNSRDTAKTAAAALLAAKAVRDRREGNGLVRTWMGTSTKQLQRQAQFKEKYKYLHPDDPTWWP